MFNVTRHLCNALLTSLLCLSIISHGETNHSESPAQTLYLLGYDIPEDERDSVVAEDIAAFRAYQKMRVAEPAYEDIFVKSLSYKLEEYPRIKLKDKSLCKLNDIDNCMNNVRQNPTPYSSSMASLKRVFNDIEILKNSQPNELVSVYPRQLQLDKTPNANYQYIHRLLLTQSVFAFYNDADQGMKTICSNLGFGKKLIQSQANAIQAISGVSLIKQNLKLLSQTTKPLSKECLDAITPMQSADISICPIVKYDANKMNNLYLGFPNVDIRFNRQETIQQVYQEIKPYCNAQWQNKVATDSLATSPNIKLYQPLLFNRLGGIYINISKLDYSYYQNRLQDVNAYLRLWQAAVDPQCRTNPTGYVNTIQKNWHPQRNLHFDNPHLDSQQRLTITAYQPQNDNSKVSTDDIKLNEKKMQVSCRTVE